MGGSTDIMIDGLDFDGFEKGFADRAGAAFQVALSDSMAELNIDDPRDIEQLDLEGLDFSSPEGLGQTLAHALLNALQS